MLLSQLLPGYTSDTEKVGAAPNAFATFITFFTPHLWGTSLGTTVMRVLIFAIVISGLVFFIKILIAGYSYMTSTGDPTKVQSATKDITNATIGLLVVISTYFVAQVIRIVSGISFL